MYLLIPAVFYALPVLMFENNGAVRLHFFQTFDVPANDLLKIGMGHVAVGSLLFYSVRNIHLIQGRLYRSNAAISLTIIVLFFAQLYTPLSYLRALMAAAFIYFVGNYSLTRYTMIPMVIIALLKLFYDYDRYPLIVVVLLYSLPLFARKKLLSQILFIILGLVSMIFVLQPLRAGLMPFSGGFGSLIYLFHHLNPIYIAAFLCMNEDFGLSQLLGETVPLGKTIFGLTTVIDIIGIKYLPKNIFELGIRHGSNVSMYFGSWIGIVILSFVMFILNRMLILIKDRSVLNAIMVLLILNAPYFIRRTLGALFIDICILIIVSIFIQTFLKLVAKARV